ncbi:hypothetical protein [Nakamurella aerolata]|uniref:Uncharacterized protein n=1 Tax=Nakamurella aerolata TaxID=1656892 RepID=A0A849AFJ6_9ACTN|nr:hypothetical protein [Nakamurella aerolata]NNG35612.1 hypothetical protein [Nakamurella aerolata]
MAAVLPTAVLPAAQALAGAAAKSPRHHRPLPPSRRRRLPEEDGIPDIERDTAGDPPTGGAPIDDGSGPRPDPGAGDAGTGTGTGNAPGDTGSGGNGFGGAPIDDGSGPRPEPGSGQPTGPSTGGAAGGSLPSLEEPTTAPGDPQLRTMELQCQSSDRCVDRQRMLAEASWWSKIRDVFSYLWTEPAYDTLTTSEKASRDVRDGKPPQSDDPEYNKAYQASLGRAEFEPYTRAKSEDPDYVRGWNQAHLEWRLQSALDRAYGARPNAVPVRPRHTRPPSTARRNPPAAKPSPQATPAPPAAQPGPAPAKPAPAPAPPPVAKPAPPAAKPAPPAAPGAPAGGAAKPPAQVAPPPAAAARPETGGPGARPASGQNGSSRPSDDVTPISPNTSATGIPGAAPRVRGDEPSTVIGVPAPAARPGTAAARPDATAARPATPARPGAAVTRPDAAARPGTGRPAAPGVGKPNTPAKGPVLYDPKTKKVTMPGTVPREQQRTGTVKRASEGPYPVGRPGDYVAPPKVGALKPPRIKGGELVNGKIRGGTPTGGKHRAVTKNDVRKHKAKQAVDPLTKAVNRVAGAADDVDSSVQLPKGAPGWEPKHSIGKIDSTANSDLAKAARRHAKALKKQSTASGASAAAPKPASGRSGQWRPPLSAATTIGDPRDRGPGVPDDKRGRSSTAGTAGPAVPDDKRGRSDTAGPGVPDDKRGQSGTAGPGVPGGKREKASPTRTPVPPRAAVGKPDRVSMPKHSAPPKASSARQTPTVKPSPQQPGNRVVAPPQRPNELQAKDSRASKRLDTAASDCLDAVTSDLQSAATKPEHVLATLSRCGTQFDAATRQLAAQQRASLERLIRDAAKQSKATTAEADRKLKELLSDWGG